MYGFGGGYKCEGCVFVYMCFNGEGTIIYVNKNKLKKHTRLLCYKCDCDKIKRILVQASSLKLESCGALYKSCTILNISFNISA